MKTVTIIGLTRMALTPGFIALTVGVFYTFGLFTNLQARAGSENANSLHVWNEQITYVLREFYQIVWIVGAILASKCNGSNNCTDKQKKDTS
jgi:hypothetical protein